MKQEDKELLLKDLCARLPYGVMCTDNRHGASKATEIDIESRVIYLFDVDEYVSVEVCRPYLRPMSSMTEEEQKEFVQFHCVNLCPVIINGMLTLDNESKMFDWLLENHFDYRGLIPKGLAIEVTKENNPYKE